MKWWSKWWSLVKKKPEPPSAYVLSTPAGKYLSFNPALDSFHVVDTLEELKIWDFSAEGTPEFWFAGNNAKPRSSYSIAKLGPQEIKKLKYF